MSGARYLRAKPRTVSGIAAGSHPSKSNPHSVQTHPGSGRIHPSPTKVTLTRYRSTDCRVRRG